MQILDWNGLDEAGRAAALARPRIGTRSDVEQLARSIIGEVRTDGDAALLRFAGALRSRHDERGAGGSGGVCRRREGCSLPYRSLPSKRPSTM
ncbi:MAG: hypothetical protein QM696_03115 [Steroidobacteraceae bacterium]